MPRYRLGNPSSYAHWFRKPRKWRHVWYGSENRQRVNSGNNHKTWAKGWGYSRNYFESSVRVRLERLGCSTVNYVLNLSEGLCFFAFQNVVHVVGIHRKLLGKAEFQVPPQIYWSRVCIFKRPPGGLYAQWSLRTTVLKHTRYCTGYQVLVSDLSLACTFESLGQPHPRPIKSDSFGVGPKYWHLKKKVP